jgi:hypothetical protein
MSDQPVTRTASRLTPFAHLQKLAFYVVGVGALIYAGCDTGTNPTPPSPTVTAQIGAPTKVLVRDTVTLSGSQSTASGTDEDITFSWSFLSRPAGSNAVMLSAGSEVARFAADTTGVFGVRLIAGITGDADTATASVESRTNLPPVAVAGNDTTVYANNLGYGPVNLDGSASWDPEDDAITYEWVDISGPPGRVVGILNPTHYYPYITLSPAGDFVIELTVSDQWDSHSDYVTVTVIDTFNHAPTADAGRSDLHVYVGADATLDGTLSSDPDLDVLTYAWSFLSRPVGSAAVINDPSASITSFTSDAEGDFQVQLEVSDGEFADTHAVVIMSETAPIEVWTQKAPFPGTPRCYPVSFAISGRGYMGTGSDGTSGGCSASYTPLADFWEYTTGPGLYGGTWTQKADFAGGPRNWAVGFAANGKGYVGMDLNGTPSDFYEYDPVGNAWRQVADFPVLNFAATSGFAIGNKGYVVPWGTTLSFYEFDPLNGPNGTWTQRGDLPSAPGNMSTSFVIGDSAYVAPRQSTQDILVYSASGDSWTVQQYPGPQMPGAYGRGFTVGNIGYLMVFSGDLYSYDPVAGAWRKKTSFPGTTTLSSIGFGIGDKGYIGLPGAAAVTLYEYNPSLD